MTRYKVVYEFKNNNGVWVKDELTDNGNGMTKEDAEHTCLEIKLQEVTVTRNEHVELFEMENINYTPFDVYSASELI